MSQIFLLDKGISHRDIIFTTRNQSKFKENHILCMKRPSIPKIIHFAPILLVFKQNKKFDISKFFIPLI